MAGMLARETIEHALERIRCHSVADCRDVKELSVQVAALTAWCEYVTALVDWSMIPTTALGGGGGGAPPPPPRWP